MPKLLRVKAWGVVVEFFWGVTEEVLSGVASSSNSPDIPNTPTPTSVPTPMPTPDVPDMRQRVLSICKGGAVACTSKEFVVELLIDATPNLLI